MQLAQQETQTHQTLSVAIRKTRVSGKPKLQSKTMETIMTNGIIFDNRVVPQTVAIQRKCLQCKPTER